MSHQVPSYNHRSRRLIASNSRFNIYFDSVSTHSGDTIPDYLLVSPKVHTDNNIVGVAFFLIILVIFGL